MEYVLAMSFICENGSKYTLAIDGVKSNITKDEISNLMDVIIENNAFTCKNGAFVEKAGATLTEKTVTSYEY